MKHIVATAITLAALALAPLAHADPTSFRNDIQRYGIGGHADELVRGGYGVCKMAASSPEDGLYRASMELQRVNPALTPDQVSAYCSYAILDLCPQIAGLKP